MVWSGNKAPDQEGDDGKALAAWVEDELERFATDQIDNLQAVDLRPIYNAPLRPREGMVVYADGSSWDPGSGVGPYYYGSDAAWHFMEAAPAWVATTGNAIFPATQVPSSDANTLDDYEEGTWTPVLTFDTPGNASIAYSEQLGVYTKIGRIVFIQASIITSTFTHTTASGNIKITGLPFTTAGPTLIWRGLVRWGGITKAGYTQINTTAQHSATTMSLACSGSGVGTSAVAVADVPSGTQQNYSIFISFNV
jgi:hypothetical protein